MTKFTFEIRAYGWRELAQLYIPDITPINATKRLSQWVHSNEKLQEELTAANWKKRTKYLTPLQVSIIVKYLGEP